MLESILILIVAMAFVLFLVATFEKSFVYMLLSVVMWLVIMASSLGVEVPGVTDAYVSYPLSAISLLFVMSGVVLSIVYLMQLRRYDSMP